MSCSSSILFLFTFLCLLPQAYAESWCESPRVDTFESTQNGLEIPDPGVLSATISATAADRIVLSVELMLDIEHSFPNDLRIYVVSPLGTRVLASALRGGHLEAFYRSRLVTDLAPPTEGASALLPMASLAAFQFETASGEWKLEVEDQGVGESGRLHAWAIRVHSCSAILRPRLSLESTSSSSVHIQDHAIVTSSLVLPELPAELCGVSVEAQIEHTYSRDLELRLIAPDGTSTLLAAHQALPSGLIRFVSDGLLSLSEVITGATGAERVSPQQPFTQLLGHDYGAGAWQLRIEDVVDGDVGILKSWTIHLQGCGDAIEYQPPVQAPGSRVTVGGSDGSTGLTTPACAWFVGAASRKVPSSFSGLYRLSQGFIRDLGKVEQLSADLRPLMKQFRRAVRAKSPVKLRAAWKALTELCAP